MMSVHVQNVGSSTSNAKVLCSLHSYKITTLNKHLLVLKIILIQIKLYSQKILDLKIKSRVKLLPAAVLVSVWILINFKFIYKF